MQNQQIDYQAVRREVEIQLKKQKTMSRWAFFITNFIMFLIFMTLSWSMVTASAGVIANDQAVGGMILLSTGWFVGLIFQFISALLDTKAMEDSLRQQAVSRAIGKALLDFGAENGEQPEKSKRLYELTDDGEIEAVPIDETQDITHEGRDFLEKRRPSR